MSPDAGGGQRLTPHQGAGFPEDASAAARAIARVRRHASWARTEGVARLVEEDQLDPYQRATAAWASRRWVRASGVAAGSARVAFVVGVQRSGTNMVVRGIERDPSVKVYNENSRRAFERFQLKSVDATRSLVERDRHHLVLFKSLCDSHRIGDLLGSMPAASSARALWVYRNVDARVRSAVHKFGDVNRRVLVEIAAGRGGGRWQAQRLSQESLDLIREVEPEHVDAETGAALFWLVRNRLYFEQGLDVRPDVHLIGYDQVVAEPEAQLRPAFAFLGLPFDPRAVEHVDARAVGTTRRLSLHPRVRAECDQLELRLLASSGVSRMAPGRDGTG